MIVRHLFAPPRCEACETTIGESPGLCEDCQNSLKPLNPSHCQICAVPFGSEGLSAHPCSECILNPPSFQKVWAGYHYEGAVIPLIHRIKFGKQVDGLKILSQRLAEKFHEACLEFQPDLVIPVPLSWWRQFLRGFNQSYLLLRYLQKNSGQKVPIHWGLHRRHTRAQAKKDRVSRLRSLKRVFRISPSPAIQSRKILLVDDVLTTGATAEALAAGLRKAGAHDVGVFVLARVEKKKSL